MCDSYIFIFLIIFKCQCVCWDFASYCYSCWQVRWALSFIINIRACGIDDVHTYISPALMCSTHQYKRAFDYLYTHIKCVGTWRLFYHSVLACVFMCAHCKRYRDKYAFFVKINFFHLYYFHICIHTYMWNTCMESTSRNIFLIF